jgi:hypothetical protein
MAWPRLTVDHSPLSTSEAETACIHTSTSPQIFTLCTEITVSTSILLLDPCGIQWLSANVKL